MEFNVFEYGAYIATGVVGWAAGVVWKRQEKFQQDFSEFKEELPINYVRKDEFKDVIKDLKESFRETVHPILAKLDKLEERMEEQSRENHRTFQRKEAA